MMARTFAPGGIASPGLRSRFLEIADALTPAEPRPGREGHLEANSRARWAFYGAGKGLGEHRQGRGLDEDRNNRF